MRFIFCVFFVAACGKEPIKANPCATKGATYFEHVVEANNGTCGPVPDQIININKDGTIAGDAPTCDSITQDGCTARNTGCKSTKNGVTCSATTSVTFMADGSSATGLITISCDGTSSCLSTYQATMLRQ